MVLADLTISDCIAESLVLVMVAAETVVLLVLTNWMENNMHGRAN